MSGFLSYGDTYTAAVDVYGNRTNPYLTPPGWKLDTSFNPNGVGTGIPGTFSQNGALVYALMRVGTDDGERILAFRGTVNAQDVYADITNIGKTQFTQSIAPIINPWIATQLVAGNNINMVGHSLGGADVQWAINQTNETAVEKIVLPDGAKATAPQFASHIQFTTFNAPGITHVLGNGTADNATNVIIGQNVVLIGSVPFLQGDVVHLLGGPPVGGNVIALQPNYPNILQGFLFDPHLISFNTSWWTDSPVVPYTPNYIDVSVAQSLAANISQLGNTDGNVDSTPEAMFRIGLFLVGAGVGIGAQLVTTAAQTLALNINLNALATALAAPVNGINQGLSLLVNAAEAAAMNVGNVAGTVADYAIKLFSGILNVVESVPGVGASLPATDTNNFAQAITDVANGLADAALSNPNSLPTTLAVNTNLGLNANPNAGFDGLKSAISVYQSALTDPTINVALKPAIEQAIAIVEAAGEDVVLQVGTAVNPFATPGFDPATQPTPTVSLTQDAAQTLTLSLPYAAGQGGQKLALQLQGNEANDLTLFTNAGAFTPDANGNILVTVPQGEQQMTFALAAGDAVTANSNLTLSTTLRQLRSFNSIGVTAVKPNYREAIQLLSGIEASPASQRSTTLARYSERLLNMTGAPLTAVTLDQDGALLFQRGKPPYRAHAMPKLKTRAIGAGDSFVSALALGLTVNASAELATDLANTAAGIGIETNGTAVCSGSALHKHLQVGEACATGSDVRPWIAERHFRHRYSCKEWFGSQAACVAPLTN